MMPLPYVTSMPTGEASCPLQGAHPQVLTCPSLPKGWWAYPSSFYPPYGTAMPPYPAPVATAVHQAPAAPRPRTTPGSSKHPAAYNEPRPSTSSPAAGRAEASGPKGRKAAKPAWDDRTVVPAGPRGRSPLQAAVPKPEAFEGERAAQREKAQQRLERIQTYDQGRQQLRRPATAVAPGGAAGSTRRLHLEASFPPDGCCSSSLFFRRRSSRPSPPPPRRTWSTSMCRAGSSWVLHWRHVHRLRGSRGRPAPQPWLLTWLPSWQPPCSTTNRRSTARRDRRPPRLAVDSAVVTQPFGLTRLPTIPMQEQEALRQQAQQLAAAVQQQAEALGRQEQVLEAMQTQVKAAAAAAASGPQPAAVPREDPAQELVNRSPALTQQEQARMAAVPITVPLLEVPVVEGLGPQESRLLSAIGACLHVIFKGGAEGAPTADADLGGFLGQLALLLRTADDEGLEVIRDSLIAALRRRLPGLEHMPEGTSAPRGPTSAPRDPPSEVDRLGALLQGLLSASKARGGQAGPLGRASGASGPRPAWDDRFHVPAESRAAGGQPAPAAAAGDAPGPDLERLLGELLRAARPAGPAPAARSPADAKKTRRSPLSQPRPAAATGALDRLERKVEDLTRVVAKQLQHQQHTATGAAATLARRAPPPLPRVATAGPKPRPALSTGMQMSGTHLTLHLIETQSTPLRTDPPTPPRTTPCRAGGGRDGPVGRVGPGPTSQPACRPAAGHRRQVPGEPGRRASCRHTHEGVHVPAFLPGGVFDRSVLGGGGGDLAGYQAALEALEETERAIWQRWFAAEESASAPEAAWTEPVPMARTAAKGVPEEATPCQAQGDDRPPAAAAVEARAGAEPMTLIGPPGPRTAARVLRHRAEFLRRKRLLDSIWHAGGARFSHVKARWPGLLLLGRSSSANPCCCSPQAVESFTEELLGRLLEEEARGMVDTADGLVEALLHQEFQ